MGLVLYPYLYLSPLLPMLVHYGILAFSIFFGLKIGQNKKKYLLISAIPVVVLWHLPWFFGLATRYIDVWVLDVFSMFMSGYVIGSCIKGSNLTLQLILFSLWMLGDSLLSYLWIVNPVYYAYPISIYPSSQFPLAGTVMFVFMDMLGVGIILWVFFKRIFSEIGYN
ncbi:MAG: DUF1404 family protein [Sulfolobaceae archaeon]|nr:DUF1404 family protein [Sulfolobaceae archaeon]